MVDMFVVQAVSAVAGLCLCVY